MAFDGTEGSSMTLAEAGKLTRNHRTANPSSIKGVYMGRDLLDQILAQSDCQGIRVYYAIKDSGEETLVFVGADSDEGDQVQGTIAENGFPCPPRCKASGLNT